MDLKNMIVQRKSFRSYTGQSVDGELKQNIMNFCAQVKPLYPDIKVCVEAVEKQHVRSLCKWIPPEEIVIYSEEKDGWLENVGFMFQQVDLYLQSIGLGSCWLGLGKLVGQKKADGPNGMKFVIMLAFGHTEDTLRADLTQFNRKNLAEICDKVDEKLEYARLAPSSINSQPWFFTHGEDREIHVYCSEQGRLRTKTLGYMNRIDMGIALAHLYVSNPETFAFFQSDKAGEVKNHAYIGSIEL